jgi:hypothetical protein
MKIVGNACATFAIGLLLTTNVWSQEVSSLVVPAESEPAPKLIVGQPLPGPLADGVAFIPYRVENLRILPIGGPGSREVSPRVGHLHITLNDMPWQWADYGQSNTIILINLPKGEHKVLIQAVNTEGSVLTSQTVTFKSPGKPTHF